MAGTGAMVAAVDGANLQRPHWSRDGKQLAWEANFHDQKKIEQYVGVVADGQWERVTVAARAPSALTAGFATPASGGLVVHELTWGPPETGRYVYAASNDAYDYDLYVSRGGPLAPHPGADGGAVWSPDGRYIAFTSARTGEGDIYVLDVRTIEAPPRRLTDRTGSSELYVSWSSDSRALVYVAHSAGGDNVWLLPSLDDPPTQLTTWPGNQIRPRFSPDSRDLVAFYANREQADRFDLYLVEPRSGTEPRVIVRGVVPDARGPAWTPSGTHIVYVADEDSGYDPVKVVNVTDPEKTATLELGTVGHGDLDVAQRGDTVVLAYVAQGRSKDAERSFKRLFVAELPSLP